MVVWFYGKEEEKKQKFPEKKIFQFFRSTNNYSKLTSLIVANQNQNHVVKFSKPEITWSLDLFLAKLSFYKLSEHLFFEMTRAT